MCLRKQSMVIITASLLPNTLVLTNSRLANPLNVITRYLKREIVRTSQAVHVLNFSVASVSHFQFWRKFFFATTRYEKEKKKKSEWGQAIAAKLFPNWFKNMSFFSPLLIRLKQPSLDYTTYAHSCTYLEIIKIQFSMYTERLEMMMTDTGGLMIVGRPRRIRPSRGMLCPF